ncbi:putative MATE efflux family protein subfamily [Plectosphaerella cucumerina]|uniref:MATE efflux family protein subfamily n=1 Tax=Plectosphaerella cucumerina TaxID=40658 RepID=A0A8K0T7C6_9PEZI|nr:putative MATE efflux family protein subfamily [Plectosphaerella cucumerina]
MVTTYPDEEVTGIAAETTPLLAGRHDDLTELVPRDHEDDVFQEVWLMVRNAAPMVVTGLLQHSIGLTNIFAVGHLGKTELGAVSLSIMTANVTGYAVFQGMATALDTLCPQAFGSDMKLHVGLYFQKMLVLLWLLIIPIGIFWFNAGRILGWMVPDKDTADLAGVYLRILLFGTPGLAAFESGKRFVQAQGIFHATTYVLLIVAPLNVAINWLLVWRMELGFIGAPMSAALSNNFLALFLFLYVYFVDGKQCWNGFTTEAFRKWGVMTRLAVPGLLMLEAEYLAFEVLTLAASHISRTQLAAQSVLSPLIALTFQAPLALAIASSTRVAALIGAGLPRKARQSAQLAAIGSCVVGSLNFVFMTTLGVSAAKFLAPEETVIEQVVKVMPMIATFQLFDSVATTLNGVLRGLGKQAIGSIISIVCYYFIAMPVSFTAAFGLGLELLGLWSGIAVALSLNSIIVGGFLIYVAPWDQAVLAARERNLKAAE